MRQFLAKQHGSPRMVSVHRRRHINVSASHSSQTHASSAFPAEGRGDAVVPPTSSLASVATACHQPHSHGDVWAPKQLRSQRPSSCPTPLQVATSQRCGLPGLRQDLPGSYSELQQFQSTWRMGLYQWLTQTPLRFSGTRLSPHPLDGDVVETFFDLCARAGAWRSALRKFTTLSNCGECVGQRATAAVLCSLLYTTHLPPAPPKRSGGQKSDQAARQSDQSSTATEQSLQRSSSAQAGLRVPNPRWYEALRVLHVAEVEHGLGNVMPLVHALGRRYSALPVVEQRYRQSQLHAKQHGSEQRRASSESKEDHGPRGEAGGDSAALSTTRSGQQARPALPKPTRTTAVVPSVPPPAVFVPRSRQGYEVVQRFIDTAGGLLSRPVTPAVRMTVAEGLLLVDALRLLGTQNCLSSPAGVGAVPSALVCPRTNSYSAAGVEVLLRVVARLLHHAATCRSDDFYSGPSDAGKTKGLSDDVARYMTAEEDAETSLVTAIQGSIPWVDAVVNECIFAVACKNAPSVAAESEDDERCYGDVAAAEPWCATPRSGEWLRRAMRSLQVAIASGGADADAHQRWLQEKHNAACPEAAAFMPPLCTPADTVLHCVVPDAPFVMHNMDRLVGAAQANVVVVPFATLHELYGIMTAPTHPSRVRALEKCRLLAESCRSSSRHHDSRPRTGDTVCFGFVDELARIEDGFMAASGVKDPTAMLRGRERIVCGARNLLDHIDSNVQELCGPQTSEETQNMKTVSADEDHTKSTSSALHAYLRAVYERAFGGRGLWQGEPLSSAGDVGGTRNQQGLSSAGDVLRGSVRIRVATSDRDTRLLCSLLGIDVL